MRLLPLFSMRDYVAALLSVLLSLLLLPCLAAAQSLSENKLPQSLKAWQDWVQYEQAYRQCPLAAGEDGSEKDSFYCAWPGMLFVDAAKDGAHIRQSWDVLAESWVFLPGNRESWPQQVRVNGQAQPVLERDGAPALFLPTGHYALSAFIPWIERPESLAIHPSIALIKLSSEGREIFPLEHSNHRLRLGRTKTPDAQLDDSVDIQVYRQLSDGLPAQLHTEIVLQVSGKAREVILGPILPEDFVPIALQSAWPAQLLADRRIKIQVSSGTQRVSLRARASNLLSKVALKLPQQDWPTQEIWSYASAENFRSTRISAANEQAVAVDPAQSNVPEAWRSLPAFALKNEALLNIEENARGLAETQGNRLQLTREMWLNFDGQGFFAHDQIKGQMLQNWRLDVRSPYRLERAAEGGTGGGGGIEQSLLVTQGENAQLSGVEWRSVPVNLDAGLRLASNLGLSSLAGVVNRFPVNGWQSSFEQIELSLRLPNGYHLLGAPGADRAGGSWIEQWDLLKVFFAAFLILLTGQLLGKRKAVLCAIFLLLAFNEPDVPQWSLAALLALCLLVKALPPGRLAKCCQQLQYAACALLLLISIYFIPQQIRYALYPQLETTQRSAWQFEPRMLGDLEQPMAEPAPAAPSELAELEQLERQRAAVAPEKFAKKLGLSSAMPSPPEKNKSQRYAQTTVVQTGSGEPNWQHGQQYQLKWSGPVTVEQNYYLLISPPWLTRCVRVLLCLLLIGLLASLVRQVFRPPTALPPTAIPGKQSDKSDKKSGLNFLNWRRLLSGFGGLSCVVLLLALGAQNNAAQAQTQTADYPPENLLQELQTRLNKGAECLPDCASIARANITLSGKQLILGLEVHSGAHLALPLPRAEKNLSLQSAHMDGKPVDKILQKDNASFLAISRGVHYLELRYLLSSDNSALHFVVLPQRVQLSSSDWQIEGVDEGRLLNESLSFTRKTSSQPSALNAENSPANQSSPATQLAAQQQFPPYVRVVRELNLDLDWSVKTTVTRMTGSDNGFSINIPLLPGEHVISPNIKVQDQQVIASMLSGETQTQWVSRLEQSTELQLSAPPLAERAEAWFLAANPSWHIEWQGVPVSLPTTQQTKRNNISLPVTHEFLPLPQEVLSLKITQPLITQGMSRAIDSVKLRYHAGQRASTYQLSFTLRASQGGEHVLKLPKSAQDDAAAEVLSVKKDKVLLNIRPRDGKLFLPVTPGQQNYQIELRDNSTLATRISSPTLDLGLPSANITLQMMLPQRWLLAALSPSGFVAPVILLWGELLVALILAVFLVRSQLLKLKIHQAILLVLGFSMFSWLALLAVLAWIFAVDWRGRNEYTDLRQKRWLFNTVQISFVLLSLTALVCIISAIPFGLLGTPDMHVVNVIGGYYPRAGSVQLSWFSDQSPAQIATVQLISLPIEVYRGAMLIWALWLAVAVFGWLKKALKAWLLGGYWCRKAVS